jgi:AcrR family transcriptional regulator
MLLREEILDAARELFIKHGYENVSMRKIASKIEYSPTTIYLYFKDKAEILHNICEETFGRLYRIMADIARTPGDPVDKIIHLGHAYIRFGLDHPSEYQLTFMTRFTSDMIETPEQFAQSAGAQTFQTVVGCVQACVDSGAFRKLDVLAASQALWAAVHGVTSLWIAQCGFPFVEQEQLIDTLLNAMLHGYIAPSARAKSNHRK